MNGLLPDDTGMFQCFARNPAGEVQTNTYLAVTSKFSRSFLGNLFEVVKVTCFVKAQRWPFSFLLLFSLFGETC